jgi:hypothetical protein
MSLRFTSDETPDELRRARFAKKTEYATSYAMRLLCDFATPRQTSIETADLNTLDHLLSDFYSQLRKETGENMSTTTMINIRYSIARHLRTKRDVDILKDSAFTRSNDVFSGKLSKLKRIGNGSTTHFDVITEEDLRRIGEMVPDNPVKMQLKVWFTIQFHFANRGVENCHGLQKNDLLFIKTNDGKNAIQVRDFMTKNHREIDNTKASIALIVESGDHNCPVNLIRDYLDKLNVGNPNLWQRPSKTMGDRWYDDQKVGQNAISTMMKKICATCSLEKLYTNHCVRATAITMLGHSFGDNDIRSISGHKSLNSIGIYKRTSQQVLEHMSAHLHTSMSQNPLLGQSDQSQCHSDCCLSFGVNDQTSNKCDIPSSSAANEIEDIHLTDQDWNDIMSLCDNVDKNGDCHDKIIGVHSAAENCSLVSAAYENLDHRSIQQQTSIQQQAIKRGDKVIILNNCSGTFNF